MTEEQAKDFALYAVRHERTAALAYIRAAAAKVRSLSASVSDRTALMLAEQQAHVLEVLASNLERGEHHRKGT